MGGITKDTVCIRKSVLRKLILDLERAESIYSYPLERIEIIQRVKTSLKKISGELKEEHEQIARSPYRKGKRTGKD